MNADPEYRCPAAACYHVRVLLHFFTAVIVGLGAAVPIGPVNLEIMRRGLRGGFGPAFLTGLGAATVDGVYSVLFTLGLSAVPSEAVREAMSYAGGAVLLVLGLLTLRASFALGEKVLEETKPAPAGGTPYLVGLTMTALNPMTLTFWASIGAAVQGLDLSGLTQRALFAGGVVAGALSWVVSFSLFLHKTRHRVSLRFERIATAAGGLALVGFGVSMFF